MQRHSAIHGMAVPPRGIRHGSAPCSELSAFALQRRPEPTFFHADIVIGTDPYDERFAELDPTRLCLYRTLAASVNNGATNVELSDLQAKLSSISPINNFSFSFTPAGPRARHLRAAIFTKDGCDWPLWTYSISFAVTVCFA